MKRRDFIRFGAGAVAVAPVILKKNGTLWAGTGSPIFVATHPQASSRTGGTASGYNWDYSVNQANVNLMVDTAVMAMTAAGSVGAAWEAVFQHTGITLSTSTKVGIKINNAWSRSMSNYTETGQNCPYGPRVETVNAVIAGLTQMLGGFPIGNITVYDVDGGDGAAECRSKMLQQGFPPSSSGTAYVYSSTYKAYIVDRGPSGNHSSLTFNAGPGRNGSYSPQTILKIVADQEARINVAIPKVNVGAGVTGCMKNLYGMTHNCGEPTIRKIQYRESTTACRRSTRRSIPGDRSR